MRTGSVDRINPVVLPYSVERLVKEKYEGEYVMLQLRCCLGSWRYLRHDIHGKCLVHLDAASKYDYWPNWPPFSTVICLRLFSASHPALYNTRCMFLCLLSTSVFQLSQPNLSRCRSLSKMLGLVCIAPLVPPLVHFLHSMWHRLVQEMQKRWHCVRTFFSCSILSVEWSVDIVAVPLLHFLHQSRSHTYCKILMSILLLCASNIRPFSLWGWVSFYSVAV